jgi:hypothetical protein
MDAAGALHHIMVGGIERIELFRGETDSNHFAERLEKVHEDTKAKGCPLPSSSKPKSVPMHDNRGGEQVFR